MSENTEITEAATTSEIRDEVYVFATTTRKWLDDMGENYANEYTRETMMTDMDVAEREVAWLLCQHVYNTVDIQGYSDLPAMDNFPLSLGEYGDEWATDFDMMAYNWSRHYDPEELDMKQRYHHALYWECLLNFSSDEKNKDMGLIAKLSRYYRRGTAGYAINQDVTLERIGDAVRELPSWKTYLPVPTNRTVLRIAKQMVSGEIRLQPMLIELHGNDYQGAWRKTEFRVVQVLNETTEDKEIRHAEEEYEAYRNSDEYQQDLADQREAEMREREMGSPNTYERDMM